MQIMLGMYVGGGVLAVPLIRRRIRPNPLYGFRVQATLDNPDLWYKVNEYAGKRLVVVGGGEAVAALGFYRVPGLSLDVYALACLGCFAVLLVGGLVRSFRYLASLEQDPLTAAFAPLLPTLPALPSAPLDGVVPRLGRQGGDTQSRTTRDHAAGPCPVAMIRRQSWLGRILSRLVARVGKAFACRRVVGASV